MFFSYKKGKSAGEETSTSSSNLFPIGLCMVICSRRDLAPTGINPSVLTISLNKIFIGFLQIEKINKAAGGITAYDIKARMKKGRKFFYFVM